MGRLVVYLVSLTLCAALHILGYILPQVRPPHCSFDESYGSGDSGVSMYGRIVVSADNIASFVGSSGVHSSSLLVPRAVDLS